MTTGKIIRAERLALGESQIKFARRFGIDQTTLSKWETRGPPTRGPGLKLVERVLAELAHKSTESAAP